jgi:hypothetical protein
MIKIRKLNPDLIYYGLVSSHQVEVVPHLKLMFGSTAKKGTRRERLDITTRRLSDVTGPARSIERTVADRSCLAA